jgi:hypothetical protein
MKFAGLGLKNMVITAIFTMLFIVLMKTVVTKHPIPGVTEIVTAV